ncbi:MAG: hypothetical protein HYR49_06765 [Gammaproteobacteria bacterium]|nr:hypothetical protein [Gammaproteobacteria bacterium]
MSILVLYIAAINDFSRSRKAMNVSRFLFPLGFICLVSFNVDCAQFDLPGFQRESRRPPMDTRRPASGSSSSTGEVTARIGGFSRELPDDHLCFNVNTLLAHNWSDPRLVEKASRLNPDVLRIPGGTEANYWDWRRGGLVDLKGMKDTPGQFRPEHVTAYDEGKVETYRGLFEATGARAMIVLNMLTSDLDSQLEYIRQALDAGLPVQYVELGNELYASRPNYVDVYPTPESYAETAARWARAIREAFPGLEVAIIGANPRVALQKSDRRVLIWNDIGIEKALSTADALTFHDYQPLRLRSREFPPEEVERALAGALRQTRDMVGADLTRRMPASSEIWVTEFNILPAAPPRADASAPGTRTPGPYRQRGGRESPRYAAAERTPPSVAGTWLHGLYVAAMAATLMEQPSVTITCNHVLLGNAAFAAIFADEKMMQAPVFTGLDQRSIGSVRPFTLSASGLTLALYSRSIQDKQKATLLDFPAAGDRSPVYGWFYGEPSGQWSAFVLNLSGRSLTFQADFLTRFGYEQLSADPGLVVFRDDQLQPVTGEGEKSLSLQPYSVTRIYSR